MKVIEEIKKGESERLEFKEVPNDRSDKWLKTVVAFANCRGGRSRGAVRGAVGGAVAKSEMLGTSEGLRTRPKSNCARTRDFKSGWASKSDIGRTCG